MPVKQVMLITVLNGGTGKHLYGRFVTQNGIKRNALFTLLFDLALEFLMTKAQENQTILKLTGTHHLVVYTENDNFLGENINTLG
jgi:hypothetical protein